MAYILVVSASVLTDSDEMCSISDRMSLYSNWTVEAANCSRNGLRLIQPDVSCKFDERLFCVHHRRVSWLRFYLIPERFSGGFHGSK